MGRKQQNEVEPVTDEEKAVALMPEPDGLPEYDEDITEVDYGSEQ